MKGKTPLEPEMNELPTPMMLALEQARAAGGRGEVPVGAVIIHRNEVLAANGNRVLELKDPTAHAEILVIREATTRLGSERIGECDLYVTLEPCTMCAGAISLARLRRLYYGAHDAKAGGVEHGARYFTQPTCHHVPDVYSGILERDCSALLKDFFRGKRKP